MHKVIKNSRTEGNTDYNTNKRNPKVLPYKQCPDFSVLKAHHLQRRHFTVTLGITHHSEIIKHDHSEHNGGNDENENHQVHQFHHTVKRIDNCLFGLNRSDSTVGGNICFIGFGVYGVYGIRQFYTFCIFGRNHHIFRYGTNDTCNF